MNKKEWKNLENHYLFHETLNQKPTPIKAEPQVQPPTESTPTKPDEKPPTNGDINYKKKAPIIPDEPPIKTIEAPKGYILVRDPTETT